MAVSVRKILIVDDSPEDRETWRRHLAGDATCQYIFVESSSLESALETCVAEQPDCILLDYHLPDGNGVEFIQELQALGGTSVFPVVVLTATGSEAVAVNAMKAGAQDYLIKHRLNPEALCRTLNAAVYKAQTDRLLAQQRSELEGAYRQAQEANARKDQFLAMLSHELRTPLMPILAAVSAPDLSLASAMELEELFCLIRRNVELETRLIDDLLDITRISHGKLDLDLHPADVHELIRHALEICRPAAQAKGVILSDELKAGQHVAQADSARLQQVFWNLLNNAIKFTPAGGQIRISTHNSVDARLEVTVTDTGAGISPDRLDRIFDAFEQGGTQISKKFGGLGLGLAICKALVEAHDGQILASSEGANLGASFRVSLRVETKLAPARPFSGTAAPAVGPGQGQEPSGASRCVLLVEDHADTARVVAMLLRRRGYAVVHAGTLAEAEALFAREPVDVIISDLGLPDGSGADLIRRLRAVRPVPSIVLSGYGEADTLAGSLEAGAQEHLIKPVAWPQLEAALGRLLANPAA